MLEKILDMVAENGYIKQVAKNCLKLGPTGILLQENLKTQWNNNIVINKEISVFPNDGNIQDTFQYARKVCLDKVPFGIAETVKSNVEFVSENDVKEECKMIKFRDFFDQEDQLTLKSTMFVPSQTSVQFFHQWQRQRRMWWRKFSASPGRYSLTDIKNNENRQSVDIIAEYPWGPQIMESILLTNKTCDFLISNLQFKDAKKNVQAWLVTSEVNLPTMFLNAICDAYDEPLFKEDERQLLRLHRKLVPYKISFAVTGSSAAKVTELSELALYLSKQLRAIYVSTLLLPSSSKYTLETQFKQYDQLGVPYTVLLNERTLVDGISLLRSRDTTLKEQVHVTGLVEYVDKLFKND